MTMRVAVSLVMLCVAATPACSSGSKNQGTDAGATPTVTTPPASTGLLPSALGSALLSGIELNAATGHVASTGATGTWQLDKGDCYSGDKDGYFGIFVKSRADKRVWVKLVKDPLKGWNVGVSVPDSCKAGSNGQQCTVQYFDAHDCTKLDVGLTAYTFKGKYTAGGHQFDGNVTFDCTAAKAHVSGTLKIEKCAP